MRPISTLVQDQFSKVLLKCIWILSKLHAQIFAGELQILRVIYILAWEWYSLTELDCGLGDQIDMGEGVDMGDMAVDMAVWEDIF